MAKIFAQNTAGKDITVFDSSDGYRRLGKIALGDNIKPDYIFLSKDGKLLYTDCDVAPNFYPT